MSNNKTNNKTEIAQVDNEEKSAPPRYILSKNPNQAMQEIMGTIDLLRLALVKETNALKEADTEKFMDLQDSKIEIARDYLDGMAQLLARKDELKAADPTLKNRLEKMRAEFADTVRENHSSLDRMKTGMKRLGERIMETVREAARKEEQLIYGANGHMQSGLNASLGVNESA